MYGGYQARTSCRFSASSAARSPLQQAARGPVERGTLAGIHWYTTRGPACGRASSPTPTLKKGHPRALPVGRSRMPLKGTRAAKIASRQGVRAGRASPVR